MNISFKTGPVLPILALVVIATSYHQLRATGDAGPVVLSAGDVLQDIRLDPPKDLNGFFPFRVPNHSLFVRRTHDLLSLIAWIRNDERGLKQTVLVGVDGWWSGHLATAG